MQSSQESVRETLIREWLKWSSFRSVKNGKVSFDNGEVNPFTESEFLKLVEALGAIKENQSDDGLKECRLSGCSNEVAKIFPIRSFCQEHAAKFVNDTKLPDYSEDGASSRQNSGYDIVIRFRAPNIKQHLTDLDAKEPIKHTKLGPIWVRIVKNKPTLYMSDGREFLDTIDPRQVKMLVTENPTIEDENGRRRIIMVIKKNVYFQQDALNGDFTGLLIGRPLCINKILGYTCYSFETRNKPNDVLVPADEKNPYLYTMQNTKYPNPTKCLEQLTYPGGPGFLETKNKRHPMLIACEKCPRCHSVEKEMARIAQHAKTEDVIFKKDEKEKEEESVPEHLLTQTISLLASADKRLQKKDKIITTKDKIIQDKDAEIERLRQQLAALKAN